MQIPGRRSRHGLQGRAVSHFLWLFCCSETAKPAALDGILREHYPKKHELPKDRPGLRETGGYSPPGEMFLIKYVFRLALLARCSLPLLGNQPADTADAILHRAVEHADVFNWADAAPDFLKAQQMFHAGNDDR